MLNIQLENCAFFLINLACENVWHVTQAERDLVANLISQRQHKFLAGRTAVRQALYLLGVEHDKSIMVGTYRQPIFDSNVVGSISHSQNYVVALAALAKNKASVALDLEKIKDRISQDLIQRIADDKEAAWICAEPSLKEQRFTLIFSAKETLYKLLYPLYQEFFGFKDASLAWDQQSNCFRVEYLKDFKKKNDKFDRSQIQIFCQIDSGFVLTYSAVVNQK